MPTDKIEKKKDKLVAEKKLTGNENLLRIPLGPYTIRSGPIATMRFNPRKK